METNTTIRENPLNFTEEVKARAVSIGHEEYKAILKNQRISLGKELTNFKTIVLTPEDYKEEVSKEGLDDEVEAYIEAEEKIFGKIVEKHSTKFLKEDEGKTKVDITAVDSTLIPTRFQKSNADSLEIAIDAIQLKYSEFEPATNSLSALELMNNDVEFARLLLKRLQNNIPVEESELSLFYQSWVWNAAVRIHNKYEDNFADRPDLKADLINLGPYEIEKDAAWLSAAIRAKIEELAG